MDTSLCTVRTHYAVYIWNICDPVTTIQYRMISASPMSVCSKDSHTQHSRTPACSAHPCSVEEIAFWLRNAIFWTRNCVYSTGNPQLFLPSVAVRSSYM